MSMFEAAWPITDPDVSYRSLVDAASRELPLLARRAGARITGRVKWEVVGGDGQPLVLVATAPGIAAGRHSAHLWAVNRAGADHVALYGDAPSCRVEGCWRVACGPGLCDVHRHAARRGSLEVSA